MIFEQEDDARRVYDVLPKRFEKYGLALHPDKTRLIEFRRPDRPQGGKGPGTFDLLGFTHHWGLTRKKKWTVQRRTAKDRLSRSLRRVAQWCRKHRHDPVRMQHNALSRKLLGHYAYYGITPNYRSISRFYFEVRGIWRKWLSRRSRKGHLNWPRMLAMLERCALPRPRIVHRFGM